MPRFCLPAVLMAVLSVPLAAHDLYLVTGVRGAENNVCARIGEHFPDSTNGITLDRVVRFQVRDAGVAKDLFAGAREEPKQLCAPLQNGPALVEMVVRPRFIELSAKDFNAYIHGENLREVIRLREQRNQTQAEGRELYSRYAKLIVGDAEDATRPLGHELEIVPEKNPSQLKPGETLLVRILFHGQPLSGVRVSAVYEGAEPKGHEFPVTAETDEQGRARLRLDRSGLWYARLIHMVPAENERDADWRSFFATLTFRVEAAGKTGE